MTHTPGPWAMHPSEAHVDAFDAGKPVPVCKLLWPTELRTEDETEANAHLIAAAPDLLDALKFAASIIGHPDDEGSKLIAAAIAKAQGTA